MYSKVTLSFKILNGLIILLHKVGTREGTT